MASRRMLLAGSGKDMMGLPAVAQEVIRLSGRPTPSVLYLGTASYDNPATGTPQCQGLAEAGCPVTPLPLAVIGRDPAEMTSLFAATDVILVSGGNTLFAVDRWRALGVDALIREAVDRGAVLCGGSAGAIVAFDAGHSDSRDPATFKNPDPNLSQEARTAWSYIRVPGLGLLSGLLCPHHDKTQSNGRVRADDFAEMARRHSGETALGIDHWAALVVEGEAYSMFALEGKEGSALEDGTFSAGRQGRPAIWRHALAAGGAVERALVPTSGLLAELLTPATSTVEDPALEAARAENPDDGLPSTAWSNDV